jgi:hypothetical protein
MDCDVLVRTIDDFGLGIVGVVDDGLVQAAEARRTIHREIVDVQGLEHVDHEIAAARALIDRVLRRRLRFDRHLPRAGHGRFEVAAFGHRRQRFGGGRRGERRGAGKRRAFEEVAASDVTALGHGVLLSEADTAEHRHMFDYWRGVSRRTEGPSRRR